MNILKTSWPEKYEGNPPNPTLHILTTTLITPILQTIFA